MNRVRLLAVASHPIQYHAPWFRLLAQRPELDFHVLFVQLPDASQQGRGFGIAFAWDIPVLDGYSWSVAEQVTGGRDGFFGTRLARPQEILRSMQPDVVLLTGWHTCALVQFALACRRAGVPVVIRGDSNALRPRPWYARLCHRVLLSLFSVFLPVGRANRRFYEGYGIPEERLYPAPYFVDNLRFAQSAANWEPHRGELRRRWSIPADAVCFCYAGKLEPKKRIHDLLEALRIARSGAVVRHPIHLLVVGSGELMDAAKAYAHSYRLPVSFAGFLNQSEIASAYVSSDCLVLPSDYGETWGLVVNEAMACGKPALVSDRVGCASDLVIPGRTGEVFAFGNVAQLSERMLDLAREPSTLAAMGGQARAHVMEHYSVEQSVEATVAAVLHARNRP